MANHSITAALIASVAIASLNRSAPSSRTRPVFLRQQTAPAHFGGDRSRGPGKRPAYNTTVYENAHRHRFKWTDSALRMPAMSERIERLFTRCREEKRAAFIPYICAGDPNFARTVEVALALEKVGADLIELGVPFSDPLADGIVNQLAAQRALDNGATVSGVLKCVREIRSVSEIPIVLYTYLNPLLRYRVDAFERDAANAGVDGLLILDLPPEEDQNVCELDCLKQSSSRGSKTAIRQNPLRIRLLAPTTPAERIAAIAGRARGFIYYVSREGVTGARDSIAESLEQKLTIIRQYTRLPVAVGFGISNPEQAATVARVADAVVVGSAIVDLIGKIGDREDLADRVGKFVTPIVSAIRSSRNQGAAVSKPPD
jgi:tryptophan synthase alpha chain